MSSDRSWRSDPSVKWAIKTAKIQPWDIMLVNCPKEDCGAQNYFDQGVTADCRLCGTSIADRADEMYSLGVAMELEIEEIRLDALGQVDEILEAPFDAGKSSIDMQPPPAPPSATKGKIALTLIWILFCIGMLAAMAVLSRYLDGNL